MRRRSLKQLEIPLFRDSRFSPFLGIGVDWSAITTIISSTKNNDLATVLYKYRNFGLSASLLIIQEFLLVPNKICVEMKVLFVLVGLTSVALAAPGGGGFGGGGFGELP